jgi:hypothetical protein
MSRPTGNRPEPPDTALLERLRPLVDRDDPVPPHVIDAARAASTWRRVDEELAELAEDSLTLAAGVRGGDARLLTYTLEGLTVEIEVSTADGRVRILGQVVPPALAWVRIEQAAGSVQVTTDGLGRFRADGLASGATRLRLTRPGPGGVPTGTPLLTPWTLL